MFDFHDGDKFDPEVEVSMPWTPNTTVLVEHHIHSTI